MQPQIAWSIDPFGSAGVSPQLFKGSGFKVLVNDRISLRLKEARKQTKELQFIWRGSESQGSRATLFTHTLDSWYWLPGGYNWDNGDEGVTPENIAYGPRWRQRRWTAGCPPLLRGVRQTPHLLAHVADGRAKADDLARIFLERAAWFRTPHLLFPYAGEPAGSVLPRLSTPSPTVRCAVCACAATGSATTLRSRTPR